MNINKIRLQEIERLKDELKQVRSTLRQALAIVKTVSYVGVDCGSGKFELSDFHVNEAKRFYDTNAELVKK
ncbi:MAG: hypothetical protein GY820_25810 [Gammaproteobacteria bacterium]|nr:hypothetical protein [Gammaproteobacteria bacterium]